jgi:hypothetical protein
MSRSLTVRELLELLADHDPDTPVMIAHQPSWPLAEVLAGVVHASDVEREADDDEPAGDECLWLVAGGHAWDRSPYAPSFVFGACEASAW